MKDAPTLGDRLAVPLLVLGALLSAAGFVWSFTVAPLVNGAEVVPEMVAGQMVSNQLLFSQKIFYFHVPVAMCAFAALVFTAVYSILYLTRCQARYDRRAKASVEVAAVFSFCVMATGVPWTRFEWGVWWTWDPRLTTYLILMLIVIAYFVMRNAVDDPELRATYASVVSVIAFVDVPICFMVTRLIPSSVHPVVTREGGMSPDMALAVMLVMAGMMLVAFGLYRLRFRQARLAERLQALKDQLDG
jgi:heme exporter protein C